ncbi:MAG: CoA-binding protein, partial [Desulfobacterales bacterium]
MTATPLSFKESAELLDRYHIQSAGKEVYSIADALDAAQSLGYPAVVKPVSKKILHKSDKGAVFLNLEGPEALTSACQELETLMGGFSQKA